MFELRSSNISNMPKPLIDLCNLCASRTRILMTSNRHASCSACCFCLSLPWYVWLVFNNTGDSILLNLLSSDPISCKGSPIANNLCSCTSHLQALILLDGCNDTALLNDLRFDLFDIYVYGSVCRLRHFAKVPSNFALLLRDPTAHHHLIKGTMDLPQDLGALIFVWPYPAWCVCRASHQFVPSSISRHNLQQFHGSNRMEILVHTLAWCHICQLCVHNRWKTRVGPRVKRKCTNNMKIYTLPFWPEQYHHHLTSPHTDD